MYIWTAILVATIGLLTSVCANGHEPELELMPKTALDEYLEIGANLPSDFPSVERDFQDNDQDKTEAKPRDDFTRAQTEIQAHRGWNKERESTSPTLDLQISSKTHSDANLVPTLDSVDVLVPSSDGYFIKHKHLDSHVVIKVVRVWREFIVPLTSTTLTGQQLLWNHANEDLIEEYVGVEFYPPVTQHFAGIFVVKRINGVLKRLMAFNYESQGKRFSYEPDMIYVERNAGKLYDRISPIHIGTTNNQGIRQVLFEIARIPEESCSNGDYNGSLEYVNVWGIKWKLTCQQLVERDSSLCRSDSVRRYCCSSCSSVKTMEDKCESDDDTVRHVYRSKKFTCEQLVDYMPRLCEKESFKKKCCKSCGRFTIRPLKEIHF